MSDLQRERELRRLEASFGLDNSVGSKSSTESTDITPEQVEQQAKPVLKKAAEGGLKSLPTKKVVSRKKPIYICVAAVLLAGAGALAFNFMDDEKGSPAPAVAIAPSQGLYIPPAVNQVPALPGRVQEKERKPVEHSEEAAPQGLPLIEEAAPLEPMQPVVSSVGEDRGSDESTMPAQTITPATAVAPQVRPPKNDSEAKVARQPAVVAAPRVIQRNQPRPASDKEIKAEVERVEAGKPWQSKIDQIKELDF